jgi:hypothetical protein
MRYGKATIGFMLGLVTVTSGCSMWGDKSASPKSDKPWTVSKLWKKEYQKPQSVAVIWSPDVLTQTGAAPTRGFGGRVFFYNERTQAVPVDGELIVHGYRGQPILGQSDQIAADKTFAFTAEQLTGHFSPSQLGASYSIWIPWDAADGFREEVTLIPTFVGTDGQVVQGAPAKLFLPGRSIELADKPAVHAQTVSYQQKVIPTNDGVELPKLGRSMKVSTIPVPASSAILRPTPQFTTALTLGGSDSAAPPAAQAVGVGGQAFDETRPQRSDLRPDRPESRATNPGTTSNSGAGGLPPLPGSTTGGATGSASVPNNVSVGKQGYLPPTRSPIAFESWTTQRDKALNANATGK